MFYLTVCVSGRNSTKRLKSGPELITNAISTEQDSQLADSMHKRWHFIALALAEIPQPRRPYI